MPKSRSRKKSDYVAPKEHKATGPGTSGRWVAPTMIALLVVGLAWVVLYYVASSSIGFIGDLGALASAQGFARLMSPLVPNVE